MADISTFPDKTILHYVYTKVLPVVYDDTLTFYEVLCKLMDSLNEVIGVTNDLSENFQNLYNAYSQLYEWVYNFFDNLDVQDEVNQKLDELVADGTIKGYVDGYLETYMQNSVDFANVLAYGAKGDGVTDDTAAFQAAINTGKDVLVPLSNFENYLINSTLNVTKEGQAFFGNVSNRRDQTGKITSNVNGYLFNVTNYAVEFYNLHMVATGNEQPSSSTPYNGINFQQPSTGNEGHGEWAVIGCSMQYFNTAIKSDGRSVHVSDNLLQMLVTCVETSYTYTGGGAGQNPQTGYRGIRIERNRAHSVTYLWHNVTGTVVGASICDNILDVGYRLVYSEDNVMHSNINRNICQQCTATSDILNFGGTGQFSYNNVCNNNIWGTSDRPVRSFLTVQNTNSACNGNVISGNVVCYVNGYCISITCPMDSNIITANSFTSINASNSTTGYIFLYADNISRLIFTNNICRYASGASNVNALLSNTASSITISSSIFKNNAYTVENLARNMTTIDLDSCDIDGHPKTGDVRYNNGLQYWNGTQWTAAN